ncbi:hypothetical protein TCELL_0731 [Thermogladius calderae 1633]|uniref:Uncharacterized protein n=2 Tax=Thermogladius calderae TaxID=1200300 RepID=I3TEG7_THEC1|nr:hypothetical protein TCELL_0731 [Thermogladius calderae 1633]
MEAVLVKDFMRLRIKVVGCLDVIDEDPRRLFELLLLGIDECPQSKVYIEEVDLQSTDGQGGSTP